MNQLTPLSIVLVLLGLATFLISSLVFNYVPGAVVGWCLGVVGAALNLARYWRWWSDIR